MGGVMLDMAIVLQPMDLVMALEIGISYIDLALRSMPLLLGNELDLVLLSQTEQDYAYISRSPL